MKTQDTEFRKVNRKGMVRLPLEWRKAMGIAYDDWLEAHLLPDGNGGLAIVMKKAKRASKASLAPLAL